MSVDGQFSVYKTAHNLPIFLMGAHNLVYGAVYGQSLVQFIADYGQFIARNSSDYGLSPSF
jgi:hypothetical protein